MASCDGMVIVFSGFRDDGLKAQIEAAGGKVATAVGKSTTHVLMKKPGKASKKMAAAHEKGLSELMLDAFVAEHNFSLSEKKAAGRLRKSNSGAESSEAEPEKPKAAKPKAAEPEKFEGGIVDLIDAIAKNLAVDEVGAAKSALCALRERVVAARAALA